MAFYVAGFEVALGLWVLPSFELIVLHLIVVEYMYRICTSGRA